MRTPFGRTYLPLLLVAAMAAASASAEPLDIGTTTNEKLMFAMEQSSFEIPLELEGNVDEMELVQALGLEGFDVDKWRSLERRTADLVGDTQRDDLKELAAMDAKELESTAHYNLGRLAEAADAMATLVSLMDSSNISLPLLRNVLDQGLKQINKTKQIAGTVVDTVLKDHHRLRDTKAQTSKANQSSRKNRRLLEDDHHKNENKMQPVGSRKNAQGGTGNKKTFRTAMDERRHADHPRVKQHTRRHDALHRGDVSFAEAMFTRFINKQVGNNKQQIAPVGRSRGLQATEPTTETRAEIDCLTLVRCAMSWTLYDLIAYFYFDDITEDGDIADDTADFNAQNVLQTAKEIKQALKGFLGRPSPEYIGCYKDHDSLPRVMPAKQHGSFTRAECIATCGSGGYDFAGLQFFDQCFCSNAGEYEAVGIAPESDCNSTCTKDNVGICGGSLRNSVWATMIRNEKVVLPAEDIVDFGPKCSGLLRLFYRNEEKDGYIENVPATWRDVCRFEGNTRYIQFGAIEQRFGDAVANQVLENALMCAQNIAEPGLFFGVNSQPRLPTGLLDSAVDSQGKVVDAHNYFSFQSMNVIDLLAYKTGGALSHDVFRSAVVASCGEEINLAYKDLFHQIGPYFADEERNNYPPLIVSCTRSFSIADFFCTVKIGSTEVQGCKSATRVFLSRFEVPEYSRDLTFENVHPVETIFSRSMDRDQALTMLVGDGVSNGLLCAHKEVPGYCCLQLPGQNKGEESWGKPFDCTQGESQCVKLGPKLSGFSEKTCALYSGTFCPYPRNCTSLLTCIADEVDWAIANNKTQYHEYVRDAPEVDNPLDGESCGDVREYFGFEADFPNDDEICEDIQLLRYNRNFDALDAFAAADNDNGGAPMAPEPELPELPDPVEAETAAPLTELEPPGPTLHSAQFHTAVTATLFTLSLTVDSLDEVFEGLADSECVDTGWVIFKPIPKVGIKHFHKGAFLAGICQKKKNVAVSLTLVALAVVKRILAIGEFTYGELDTLSNFNMDEIYQNVNVLHTNMGILQEGFTSIAQQNVANTEILIERFEGVNRIQNQIATQVYAQFDHITDVEFDFVNTVLENRFDSVDAALTGLSNLIDVSCAGGGVRRNLLQLPPAGDSDCDCATKLGLPQIEAPPVFGYEGRGNEPYSLPSKLFQGTVMALDFLNRTLQVRGCGESSKSALELSVLEEGECKATVEAKGICVGSNLNDKNSTAESTSIFDVKVDKEPPQISCSVKGEKGIMLQESTGFLDVGLLVTAKDGCSSQVDVDISVDSTELQQEPMVVLTKMRVSGNETPRLFVSASTCKPDRDHFCVSTNNDGSSSSGADHHRHRVYRITVKGTDEAGWTSTVTCHAVVVPKSSSTSTKEIDRELRGQASLPHWMDYLEEEDGKLMNSSDMFALETMSLQMVSTT